MTPIAFDGFVKIGAEVLAKAELVVDKAAQDLAARAQQDAPVDTGNLRASVLVGGGLDKLERTVFAAAEYAHYVEFGTHTDDGAVRTAPQPFLQPAAQAVRPAFLAAMAAVVGGSGGEFSMSGGGLSLQRPARGNET